MDRSISRARYYVVYDGAWKIQCDGENSEPYERKSDAFKAAVALAHLDTRNGREADVIVQWDFAAKHTAVWPATLSRSSPSNELASTLVRR